MISNEENVARVLFSPRMILEGKVIPVAFELRESINENYLSVLRTSVETWEKEMMNIPQRKNRQLFGYALMNAGEIRNLKLNDVIYDVQPYPTEIMKSHAGITITYKNQLLQGGTNIEPLPAGMTEDFLLLSIRSKLTALAQTRIVQLADYPHTT